MRAPGTAEPRPPRRAQLHLVRYVDRRGDTVSRIFYFRDAAERFAALVVDRGGSPTVHTAEVAWVPSVACRKPMTLVEPGHLAHPTCEPWPPTRMPSRTELVTADRIAAPTGRP